MLMRGGSIPCSSRPKRIGEDNCDPLPPRRRSPSIHLGAGEAMGRRPQHGWLLVFSELPHHAGKTNNAASSARLLFSSPTYCVSMQSKRWVASLGAAALLVSNVLPLDADELHGNHERGDEIYMAALLVSGDLPPRVR